MLSRVKNSLPLHSYARSPDEEVTVRGEESIVKGLIL